ncbi:hypothetical protein RND81_11G019900 [Saponaria officinalis]|uniref:Uncharacterized protein n=1 Tax=Saponaria officinalis TaxID=3572 RepID=A0AAW1HIH7_SAPOF
MLTERTRQQNHEHIINKGINISINSKYFCDFTDCFCDFSHIVCDFSDYFRDFCAKLPSRPLICVNPYFSDYFCDFSKNFCDFCKNFCDFTSNIVPKLEEVAAKLILIVSKKEAGFVKLAGSGGARKEEVGIDVEIFECAPSIHFVEMKKSNGDTME